MNKKIVYKNEYGERIDKFLKQEVFLNMEITRGEIIRNIKTGNVLVNGKKIKPSYQLKENDSIEADISEERKELEKNKDVKFEIIFENENFVVIDKPAGLQIHRSTKNENDTLVNGLLYKFPEMKMVGDDPRSRPGIVHRLDRWTSGVMVAAKNQKTFLELKEKFKNRETKKTYLALVFGKLEEKSGTIDAPLAKSADYKKQIVANGKTKTKIRSALTNFKVIKEFQDYSLLEVFPKTGRTHQIRTHLAFIGHPILGDEKYYPKKFFPKEKFARYLLHAKKLEFELFSEKFSFESTPPKDFLKYLEGSNFLNFENDFSGN